MNRQITAVSAGLAVLVAAAATPAAAAPPESGGPPANLGICVMRLATTQPSAVGTALKSWAPITIFFGETFNVARIPPGQVGNGQEMVACGKLPGRP
jgi:hypothetical protein